MTDTLVLIESNTTGSGRLFAERAREMGLHPVMLARDPDRYPYVRLDGIEARVVDTVAPAAIGAACAALDGRICGVTSSSEYFIGAAAAQARALGLPHPDPEAIAVCRDKATQRERLAAGGLPGPAFVTAPTPEVAADAAVLIGFPVVVKPVAGSGSIGVRRCATAGEVVAAAAAILEVDPATIALPPQRAVVVEEYLSGDEYSVETLDEVPVGVTRKHLGPEPFFVEIGHDFPATLGPAVTAEIGDAAVAALRALGLGWGCAHVELRYGPGGPRIVEVNPRLAGGMIPRMVQEATGIDMIAYQVAKAAGRAVLPAPSRARSASIRFLVAPVSGRLASVRGIDVARAANGIVEAALTREVGQDIELRQSFQDRLGYVIAAADDQAMAARCADDALRSIEADIQPLQGARRDQ